MSVLIVVESEFGNTTSIANSIAEGLGQPAAAIVCPPSEAPATIPEEVGLLLVGAPTHNLHAPTPASRQKAAERAAYQGSEVGALEWIAATSPRPDLAVFTFDTAVAGPFSGSAAKALAKLLRRRGFAKAAVGRSFIVTGTEGPLGEGELAKARQWGAELTVQR
jgi:hypothetical protein